ncbi:hypothetical protein PDIDSM_5751 [Penicillium digitatum]|nr:hypothetical protein PDIDSM_5751 [Penicillium digitatum]
MSDSAREQISLNSPPPPPPPPPPEIPGSKISSYVLKLRTAPSDYFFQAPNPPKVNLISVIFGSETQLAPSAKVEKTLAQQVCPAARGRVS